MITYLTLLVCLIATLLLTWKLGIIISRVLSYTEQKPIVPEGGGIELREKRERIVPKASNDGEEFGDKWRREHTSEEKGIDNAHSTE